MEFFYQSSTRYVSQVCAVIFHILQVMLRRKILKVVNLGKEIENDKKLNEKKLGPCMHSLILTLTLPWICFIQNNDFEKDQILKK